jgi:alkyldihydroxyacetonephosphate synthase
VPIVVGSEGTLAIVTSATLRLHPAPTARGFGAWSFPTTEHGWEAIRALFQAGLRPAVSRLYDPFDAMLARQGGVKRSSTRLADARSRLHAKPPRAPGLGHAALRTILRRPNALNELVDASAGLLGGSLLVVIFEGTGDKPQKDVEEARAILSRLRGAYEGEGPARKWLQHRYSVSYRQAPVFAAGAWVDTMEVAAPWSKLAALYDGVRRAMGKHVFVMAHFSHAYPDGCCIYFSFAGSAGNGDDWNAASEATYDRVWPAALDAALAAGGTLSHHHGVGRSKAPRLGVELGTGVDVVRALQRAFDPNRVLNPGNLLPPPLPEPYVDDAHPREVHA